MFCCRTSALVVAVTGLLLAVAGCARKSAEQPPPATPAAAQAPAAVQSSGPATPQAADSSLSIKRGIVTAAGDHATFRACDDNAELWLIDEADGALTQLLTEDASTFFIEAYGERSPVPDNLPAARGQAGVFVLEQLLFAGVDGESRGCEQPAPDFVVAARGNEPFWAATVTATGISWKQPDLPQPLEFSDLQSDDAEGTVIYRATAHDQTLELEVNAQSCRDSMSGEFFAFSAQAKFGEKLFKGCARVGTQDAR